ncbi:MAG: porin family protein [Bacteroidaceae bacterium]|nr:porin family protein [Bacteroidaceae bacterium]
MKRTISLLALFAIVLSACNTIHQTATTANVSTSIQSSVTMADLKVGDRITYTMTPSKEVLRGGEANVRHVAEAEALTQKGGHADILLEPQYVVSKKRGLFSSKITSVTVSGRPASYTNFRSLPDSVLCNPVFRGVKTVVKYAHASKPLTEKQLSLSHEYAPDMRQVGMASYLELHIGPGFSDYMSGYSLYPNEVLAHLGATLTVGYNITPHWYVAPGIGVDYCDEQYWSMPIFANVRYNFSKSRKSWFAEYRLGCAIGIASASSYDYDRNSELESGVYTGIGLGYSFKHFEMALRYTYQNTGVAYWSYYNHRIVPDEVYGAQHLPSISFGWRF